MHKSVEISKVKWNSFMMGAKTVNIPYKLFPFLPTVYIRQKAPFLPFTRCFNIMMTIMILELVRFWCRCRHNTRWMVCHYLKCSSVAWHSTRIFTVTHLEIQKTIFTFILFIDLISYATVSGWQKVLSIELLCKKQRVCVYDNANAPPIYLFHCPWNNYNLVARNSVAVHLVPNS